MKISKNNNLLKPFLICIFVFSPMFAKATSTVFSPTNISTGTDMYDHMSAQIDDRLLGLSSSTSLSVFSSQNFSNQTYVRNTDVWTSHGTTSLDLTGISPWNNTGVGERAGVLISPRHVVFANHFPISNGATMVFVDNLNATTTRTMVNSLRVADSDIIIGILDSDVPNSITYYPIIEDPVALAQVLPDIENLPILSLDQEEKALVFNSKNISYYLSDGVYVHDNSTTTSFFTNREKFKEQIIPGDSGNPSFFIIDNKLVLISVYSSADDLTATSDFQTSWFDEINTTLLALGGGYEASTVDLSKFNTITSNINSLNTNESTLHIIDTVPNGTNIGQTVFDLSNPDQFNFVIQDNNHGLGISATGSISVIDRNSLSEGYLSVLITSDYGNSNVYRAVESKYLTIPINIISATSTISNISHTSSNNSINITWNTVENATSTVYYGLTDSYGSFKDSNTLTTNHSITIDNLTQNTTYHFRLDSLNVGNVLATSSDITFTTNGTPVSSGGGGGGSSGGGGSYFLPTINSTISSSTASSTVSQTTTNINPISEFVFIKTLKYGTTHSDVKKLQQFLNSRNFIISKQGSGSKGKETNYFGPATKSALIKFQKSNKLPATGFFGPMTIALISK